jgi:hypothetical protein
LEDKQPYRISISNDYDLKGGGAIENAAKDPILVIASSECSSSSLSCNCCGKKIALRQTCSEIVLAKRISERIRVKKFPRVEQSSIVPSIEFHEAQRKAITRARGRKGKGSHDLGTNCYSRRIIVQLHSYSCA